MPNDLFNAINTKEVKDGVVAAYMCCSRYTVQSNNSIVTVTSKVKLEVGDRIAIAYSDGKWVLVSKTGTSSGITRVRV